jgi:hypothetical protein
MAMSKPARRRTDYERRRTIMLADGTGLVTVRDAANVLLEVFGSVNARSSALDRSTRLLLTAAETGKRGDIAAATEAIERVLRGRRLL